MKLFIFLMMLVAAAMASDAVVSGAWVYEHQKQKGVIIVDVSAPEAYEEGHIPGAINSPIGKWRMGVDGHSEVSPPEALQAEMRRLGIGKDSKVVVYSHHIDGKDILKATYVIWAMAYAGFEETVLLDGGLKAYVAATGKLSKKAEADRHGDYTVKVDAGKLAKIDEVRAALGKEAMVDSRPAVYYFGAELQSVLKRAGHINEAHSYFWAYSLNGDKTLKPEKLLRRMIEDGLGLYPSAPVIVYCTGGLEASMNYFVLHRVLGFEKAKLYDASMKEWANRDDTPMTVYQWE